MDSIALDLTLSSFSLLPRIAFRPYLENGDTKTVVNDLFTIPIALLERERGDKTLYPQAAKYSDNRMIR